MPDDDRLTLFAVRPGLQAAADALVRQAVAAHPVCRHPGAVLVSALDTGLGPWCAGICGFEPMASLLADPFCSLCRHRPAADGLLQLHVDVDDQSFTLAARVCPDCLLRPPTIPASTTATGNTTTEGTPRR
ncbi:MULTISPECIES: hypothetical protein [unclassified Streptomyces]|uniref:hypothetical protein n=1 Tax=unclassified Streptomyces TaxID=2593676 RepID=UPI002E290C3E|nr:hypothetical protein [Streptomyces sp. NBC_00228]